MKLIYKNLSLIFEVLGFKQLIDIYLFRIPNFTMQFTKIPKSVNKKVLILTICPIKDISIERKWMKYFYFAGK